MRLDENVSPDNRVAEDKSNVGDAFDEAATKTTAEWNKVVLIVLLMQVEQLQSMSW